jgi:hypothetical protein
MPARRGSLDGPGRKLSPATMGMEPRPGFLVASLWVDTAVTSPLAPRAGRDRPWGSAAGHSFVPTVRGAWCVPATARRAALSSTASPEGGHGDLRARALAVSEPCSTGLPDQAADLAVPQPVEDQGERSVASMPRVVSTRTGWRASPMAATTRMPSHFTSKLQASPTGNSPVTAFMGAILGNIPASVPRSGPKPPFDDDDDRPAAARRLPDGWA